jgi:hypothetical protein
MFLIVIRWLKPTAKDTASMKQMKWFRALSFAVCLSELIVFDYGSCYVQNLILCRSLQ